MQRERHFWSLPLRLLPGLVMQALKHLSRTVCGGGERLGRQRQRRGRTASACCERGHASC
jgi:hypothetical protein